MSETAAPTAEEIKAQSKLAMSSMFGDRPLNKPAEEPVTEVAATPATEVQPAAPAAPAAQAAPAAPAKTEAEAREELIRQTADATADRIADRFKPTTPAAPAAPEAAPVEMGAEDKADYEVLVALGETDPAYAEKAREFAEFTKKNYEYQDQWLAANPGKEFNPNDDEHTAWYEANQKITADDIKEAKDELRIVKIAERRVAPTMKKIEEREREEVLAKAMPAVVAASDKRIIELVNAVNPDIGKAIVDDKGNLVVTDDTLKKAEDVDPIAAKVLVRAAATVNDLVQELEKSATPELGYKLNPRTNPVHAEIFDFHMKLEKDRSENPVAGQKPFVRIAEFNKRMSEIERSTPAAKREAALKAYADSVSLVTYQEIQQEIVRHYSEEAKKVITEADSLAQRKYKPSASSAQTTPAATAPNPQPAAGKPKSPSLGSQTVPVTTQAADATQVKNIAQSATKQMFG